MKAAHIAIRQKNPQSTLSLTKEINPLSSSNIVPFPPSSPQITREVLHIRCITAKERLLT
jgi:hypothetical protein